jgi:hypothetical protein
MSRCQRPPEAHLLDEPVGQREPRLARAVGPVLARLAPQEQAAPRERIAQLVRVLRRDLERRRDEPGRKLLADHARGLEHALLLRAEPIELDVDHLLHRVRPVRGDVVDRRHEPPPPAVLADHPARHEVVEDRHDEQRRPAGDAVHRRDEAGREGVPREPHLDEARDGARRDPVERHGRGVRARHEAAHHAVERMRDGLRLRASRRRDHEEPRALAPLAEEREQIDRRDVRPLKVLQHDHDRVRARERLDRLDHLAHRASVGAGARALRHLVELTVGHEVGQLREERRRELHERRERALSVLRSPQLAEHLDHREVRLGRAVLLDALAAHRGRLGAVLELFEEGVHEARLPDAGLAGHEAHLALPRVRALERRAQGRQLCLAAHEHPLRSRRPRLGRERCRPHRLRVLAELRGEPVAAADHRLDHAVAQDRSQLVHVGAHGALAHDRRSPDVLEQLLMGHEPLRVRDEIAQDREWLASYGQELGSLPQPLLGRIHLERRERDHAPTFYTNRANPA